MTAAYLYLGPRSTGSGTRPATWTWTSGWTGRRTCQTRRSSVLSESYSGSFGGNFFVSSGNSITSFTWLSYAFSHLSLSRFSSDFLKPFSIIFTFLFKDYKSLILIQSEHSWWPCRNRIDTCQGAYPQV